MASSYPKQKPLNVVPMMVKITDVSTADEHYLAPGFRGRIKKILTALGGAIGTADADITVKIDGVAVTGGVVTIATAGSAAGDLDSAVPTANDEFTETSVIEVETDGASSNTVPVCVTLLLEAY
jgi:hypothetical protein